MTSGHTRRSIRLPDRDYTSGAYFVTICSLRKRPLFGEVAGSAVALNPIGEVVAECWRWLGHQYPHVEMDEWVLMPNHLHGILILHESGRGGSRAAPTPPKGKPLGGLIGAFKTVSTKRVNIPRGTPGARIWQRGYYEHAIRSEVQLRRAREYVVTNPLRWALDEDNPQRTR